jgi:hypothetical protein
MAPVVSESNAKRFPTEEQMQFPVSVIPVMSLLLEYQAVTLERQQISDSLLPSSPDHRNVGHFLRAADADAASKPPEEGQGGQRK